MSKLWRRRMPVAAALAIGLVLASAAAAQDYPSRQVTIVVPFAAGGPGWGVGFGLLLAGVSVSGGLTGIVPRWFMWFGISLAAIAELSALTLLTIYAAPSIPIARFVGFVWLVVVALKLPRSTTA